MLIGFTELIGASVIARQHVASDIRILEMKRREFASCREPRGLRVGLLTIYWVLAPPLDWIQGTTDYNY